MDILNHIIALIHDILCPIKTLFHIIINVLNLQSKLFSSCFGVFHLIPALITMMINKKDCLLLAQHMFVCLFQLFFSGKNITHLKNICQFSSHYHHVINVTDSFFSPNVLVLFLLCYFRWIWCFELSSYFENSRWRWSSDWHSVLFNDSLFSTIHRNEQPNIAFCIDDDDKILLYQSLLKDISWSLVYLKLFTNSCSWTWTAFLSPVVLIN